MALPRKPARGYIDFESRSQVDLRKHGTHRYATSPTTDPMVMAFRLPHWAMGRTEIWFPDYPQLGIEHQGGNFDALFELFEWIANGGLVEAHNAWFERNIWRHIMVPRYGWPEMPNQSWRCSAAQAAAVALPRGLDDALSAMRLALQKDATGAKVMMKMTKPRKPRKAEREAWQEEHGNKPHSVLYHEDRHLLMQLFDYVRQDVLAEEGLSYVLPDLSADELRAYQMDQMVNDRGFQLDMEAVEAALYLLQEEAADLNAELQIVTEGQVERATQRDRMKAWLITEGVELDNTQAATLDEWLSHWPGHWSEKAKRALTILRTLGRSSTSKYEAMSKWADLTDGRVRGGLLYHGATTGRWSGVGVQVQNLPKGSVKDSQRDDKIVQVDELWTALKTLDREVIRTRYNTSVLEALSHGIRSALVAGPGQELFVADFASIEARVVLWLAGDEAALDIFRSGKDIYLYTAEGIYKRPLTKADSTERQMGKQAVLGLGFQMGPDKFVATVAKYGIEISLEFAQEVVAAYRKQYWRTKQLWMDQEDAAILAVKSKRRVDMGMVSWYVEGSFLYCELPSGRRLAYPFAFVKTEMMPWGKEKETLQFRTTHPKTHQWVVQKTYGGMIVENITQAVARDLIAGAMLRLEQSQVYLPVLSVHDEAIAEAVIGRGNVQEFEHLVSYVPEWGEGLPVAAEAWKGLRYKK